MNSILDFNEDDLATQFETGKLTFGVEAKESGSETSAYIRSWANAKRGDSDVVFNEEEVDENGICSDLKFEVVSARTIESPKKHVAYTVMVRKDVPVPDAHPSVIERRYTEFLELYKALCKEFPTIMVSVSFPKKALMGNFTPEMISSRSASFEALLKFISENERMKNSNVVINFLQSKEQEEARKWILEKRYDQISGVFITAIGYWMEISLQRFIKISEEFLSSLPLLLMIAGFIIIIIGCSASTCMKKPCLLVTYGCCLVGFFLLEIIIMIMIVIFRGNVYQTFGKTLNVSMAEYPENLRHRYQMDEIQIQFECCGYFGPGDWYNTPIHQIPQSCCKIRFCDPTKVSEIFNEGCMEKIYKYLANNLSTIILLASIVGSLPLFGAFISFCLSYQVFLSSYQKVASDVYKN